MCLANHSRTVASVPRPPTRSEGIYSPLQWGGDGGGASGLRATSSNNKRGYSLPSPTGRGKRKVDALFVAAHVERPSFSLISQLGFIDPCLSLDAIEYNNQQRYSKLLSIHGYLKEQTQYSASDAHCPEQIGTQPSIWQTEELTFDGLRKAFDQKDNHLIFASHG